MSPSDNAALTSRGARRLAVVSPRSWIWPVAAIWAVMTPFLLLFYAQVPPNPDQALFDYIGWIGAQGGSYYADAFEINWPGAFFLHEMAQRLFGPVPWAFRVFDYGLMLVACAGGAWLLAQSGFARAAGIFVLLYPPLYVTAGGWMSGQRDIMVAGLALVALALILPRGRGDGAALAAAGAILGGLVLVRPTWLALLALVLLVEVLGPARPGWRRRTAMGLTLAGALAVVVGTLAAGLLSGTLRDWWEQGVLFVHLGYRGTDTRWHLLQNLAEVMLSWWHWPLLLGLLGLAAWARWWRWLDVAGRRALLLSVALLAVVLLSYAVMNKGFRYHLGGALTVFLLWAAVLLDRLWFGAVAGTPDRRWPTRGALLVCVLLVLVGTGKKLVGFYGPVPASEPVAQGTQTGQLVDRAAQAELVDWIRAETAPGEPVFQWGWNYRVVQLAERPPSTRFITTPVISGLHPGMPFHDAWVAEMTTDFRDRPPAVVLLDTAPLTGRSLPLRPLEPAPIALRILLDRLNAGDYRIVRSFDDLLVLARDR